MLFFYFTDPSDGTFTENPFEFSSYYQYDSMTKKLVRIRLELKRNSKKNTIIDRGETLIIVEEKLVGFSNIRLGIIIKENEDYRYDYLRCDGSIIIFKDTQDEVELKLSQTPKENDWAFDVPTTNKDMHFGNRVTTKPNLPPGIKQMHLSLLANQAIIENIHGKDILTIRDASITDLAESIKKRVAKICNKDFDQINEEEILKMLKQQITKIKNSSERPVEEAKIEAAVENSSNIADMLRNKLALAFETGFTMSKAFSTVYKAFEASIKTLKEAKTFEELTKSIRELKDSQIQVKQAFAYEDKKKFKEIETSFEQSDRAIDEVIKAKKEWDASFEEYKQAEEATTIDEYEESLRGTEAE